MIHPLLAILLAVLASSLIGAAWYSSWMFGKTWRAATRTPLPTTPEQKAKAGRAMMGNMLATFPTMIGLAAIIELAKPAARCPLMLGAGCVSAPLGVTHGILIGAGIWFFFLVPTILQPVFFEQKSWRVTLINLGYRFAELVAAGALLGALI